VRIDTLVLKQTQLIPVYPIHLPERFDQLRPFQLVSCFMLAVLDFQARMFAACIFIPAFSKIISIQAAAAPDAKGIADKIKQCRIVRALVFQLPDHILTAAEVMTQQFQDGALLRFLLYLLKE